MNNEEHARIRARRIREEEARKAVIERVGQEAYEAHQHCAKLENAIRRHAKEVEAANEMSGSEIEYNQMCVDANCRLMGVLDE